MNRRKMPPPPRRSQSPKNRRMKSPMGGGKRPNKKSMLKNDLDNFEPPKLIHDEGFLGSKCYKSNNG